MNSLAIARSRCTSDSVVVPVSGFEYQSVMTGILCSAFPLTFFLLQDFSFLSRKSSILRVLVVTLELSLHLFVLFALVTVLLEVLLSILAIEVLLKRLDMAPVDCLVTLGVSSALTYVLEVGCVLPEIRLSLASERDDEIYVLT